MAKRSPELSDGELEVLKVLWEGQSNTVREVMDRLHAQGRKLAYTTVLTFMNRLEQKGYVRSDKAGLAYVYQPRQSRERVISNKLRTIAEQLFDGAAGPMVLQLMKSERFTPEEIDEFRRLINQLDRQAEKGSAGSSANSAGSADGTGSGE